jgi:NADPH:quinone reductase-like Zn-dependent oxidoreductase
MKAIVQDRYGSADVLRYREIAKPDVGDDEVLVRVRAAGVNALDWHVMRGSPFVVRPMLGGWRGPRPIVRGVDVAGAVEAVGRSVQTFQPGDAVFGWCQGAFAEYARADADHFVSKPATLTFEQAAAVPLAAITALQGVRDAGQVRAGQRVLVVGASGGVGTYAVQIAKAFGASVTGVCSARNVELVASLGADEVIDYERQDPTATGARFDLIFELAGTRSAWRYRRALTDDGRLVLSSGAGGRWLGPIARMAKAKLASPFVHQTMVWLAAAQNHDDLAFVTKLIETGAVTPVIDRCYGLSQAPEAIRYVETGHTRGKTVITA